MIARCAVGNLFDILDALTDSDGREMLATIIRVEGSAYRKEGAMMLLTGDRKRYGLLSGGCLEDDLAERAEQVWEEGVAQTVVYDLSAEDDLSWGQGVGCDGTIHVLVEPLNGELTHHLRRLQHELNEGTTLLHVKKLSEHGSVTDYLFYAGNNRWFGSWNGPLPDHLDRLYSEHRKAGLKQEKQPSDRLFIQTFEPKPRLIIFGAGPDVKPLVRFAAGAGFHVVVTDWRPALCSGVHFPEANELIVGFPDTVAAEYKFTKRDSVIVMTHHFQKDRQIFDALRFKQLQYFGILGPKARAGRLAGGAVPDWLHSPVGLPIGAEGPEEIAISILADVIKSARLRRDNHDMGDLFGGRPKRENGATEASSANRG